MVDCVRWPSLSVRSSVTVQRAASVDQSAASTLVP